MLGQNQLWCNFILLSGEELDPLVYSIFSLVF